MTNFNDIESKFKETLQEFSPSGKRSDNELWGAIEAGIQTKSRKRWMWWFGFALLLVATTSLGYFWNSDVNNINTFASTEAAAKAVSSTPNERSGESEIPPTTAKTMSDIQPDKNRSNSESRTQVRRTTSTAQTPIISNPISSTTSSNTSSTFTSHSISESDVNQIAISDIKLEGKSATALALVGSIMECCSPLEPAALEVPAKSTVTLANWRWDMGVGTNYWFAANEQNTKHQLLPGKQIQLGVSKYLPSYVLSAQVGWSASRYVFDYVNTFNQDYTYNQIPLGVVIDQNGNVVSINYGDSTVTATYTRKVRSINTYQSVFVNAMIGKEWKGDRWQLAASVGPKFMFTYMQQGTYVGVNDMPSGKISEAGNGLKSFAVLPTVQLNVNRRLNTSWNIGIGVNASVGYAKLWGTYGKGSFVQMPVMLRLERRF